MTIFKLASRKVVFTFSVVSVAASPRGTSSQNQAHESESDSDSESLIDVEGVPCERRTKSLETKRIRRYDEVNFVNQLRSSSI